MSSVHSLVLNSVIFAILSERGIGPRLYGVFPGGRIEQYLEVRCILLMYIFVLCTRISYLLSHFRSSSNALSCTFLPYLVLHAVATTSVRGASEARDQRRSCPVLQTHSFARYAPFQTTKFPFRRHEKVRLSHCKHVNLHYMVQLQFKNYFTLCNFLRNVLLNCTLFAQVYSFCSAK